MHTTAVCAAVQIQFLSALSDRAQRLGHRANHKDKPCVRVLFENLSVVAGKTLDCEFAGRSTKRRSVVCAGLLHTERSF